MRSRAIAVVIAVLSLLLSVPSLADVRPAKVFADHMVLQQEMPINVFGSASAGEKVTVELRGATASAVANGAGRWLVKLPAMKADGKPATLSIRGKESRVELKDILLGEVWLTSGQSNMGRGVAIKEAIPGVRLFYLSKTVRGVFPYEHDYDEKVTAGWCECSPEALAATPPVWGRSGKRVARTSYGEVAVVFAKRLHERLGVPVGVMNIAFAGSTASSWTPKPGLEKEYPFGKPIEQRYYSHKPGVMYQTQLRPIVPLSIRGVVWYQGEDDGRNPNYHQDLKRMIESWRELFGQPKLPFYMIQIGQTTYASGMLRVWESQAWVMANVPNTGLVPSNDLQDNRLRLDEKGALRQPPTGYPLAGGSNPHPPNKHLVAERAADIALAKIYGKLHREVFGPMYGSHTIDGRKVVIKFKHVGDGLRTDDGKPPNWFQVAPPLSREAYHPSELHYMLRLRQRMISVQAEIIGKDTVVVHLPAKMKEAFWVSFAWHPLSRSNLRNSEGLSAIPFRIWDGVPARPKE